MKQLTFFFNSILIVPAILLTILKCAINQIGEIDIPFLIIFGLYQVIISFGITIYYIFNNKKMLMLYLIYWVLVFIFFSFIIQNYFYSCIIIALYNLYIHYCSFSESKFNIIKS